MAQRTKGKKSAKPRAKRTSKLKKAHMIGKLLLFCFILFIFAVGYFVYDLPDINNVKPIDTKPSITILADNGEEIARYGGKTTKVVPLSEIPKNLTGAVIATEDRRFYKHHGIDPIGIARAMVANLIAGHFKQGGSTITQQLTKNLFLTPDKTIKRKVQEALMALQIEHKYSKDEILEAYLNRVYLGAGAYGVEAASNIYFDKHVKDLNLWESAVIAGLLKAPSRYSPTNNPELSKNRAKAVLANMKEVGFIDEKTDIDNIKILNKYMSQQNTRALKNYFADWVINQIDSFITTTDGDIVVRTTLNMHLQNLAEEKLLNIYNQISTPANVGQIALVSQNYDGAILAMVGGVDYKKSQFNRVTQAMRQPGSAFKPFVYLGAIESGFSPDDYIEDAPNEDSEYKPENYNEKYYGNVTLREALQRSLNSATVNLLQKIGLKKLNDVVSRIGLNIKINQDLSAALGTSEVTLLALNNAYTVFANRGKIVWPYAVKSIEDSNGEILYQRPISETPQAFLKKDISTLNSMLEGVLFENGTGHNARYTKDEYLAGKTGTTQNFRDAWFIGYSNKLITGVWMGNDDNSPTNHITGGSYPAILWANYMKDADGEVKSTRQDDEDEPLSGIGSFFDMLGKWTE